MPARLRPNWTFLASTIESVPVCPYRAIVSMLLDATRYFANGWNQAWYADLSALKLFPLGSTVPTTFAVADAAGGATFPLGQEVTYYLVFRNSTRQEETAPQIVTHTMVATKDTTTTWTPLTDGRWDKARIYRRKNLSDDIVRVADVAMATGTYTDTTSDANLSTLQADVYVPRYRETLPPKFKAMSAHLGRILGVTGTDSLVYFSQAVRADGELVQTDFPAGNILAVEPDDGLGEIVTIFGHNDLTVVVKRQGAYIITGDFGDDSLTFRLMYRGRGALSSRAWSPVHAAFVLCDEQGLYGWTPDAEPVVLGAKGGNFPVSPLAPLWRRINRAAADKIHLVLREEAGTVEVYLPLDHEPVARRAAVWNFRENRFDSIDDRVSLAAGTLEDSDSDEHECYLDDLGLIWERGVIVSQGVEAGSTGGALSGVGSNGIVDCSAAAFSTNALLGPTGSPTERRSAAVAGSGPGTLISANRVLSANSGTTLQLLYRESVAFAAGQTLDVGTIAFVPEFAASDYGTADRKTIPRLIVRFSPQAAFLGLTPTLNVYSGMDQQAYTFRAGRQSGDGVDMTNADGWALVPCWDRGFRWNLRFEAHRAGDAVELQALTADVLAARLRR